MAIPTKSPISQMSGRLPATPPHAIQTGNWLAPAAPADPRGFETIAAAAWLIALAFVLSPATADARAGHHFRQQRAEPSPPPRALPYPALELPLEIPGSQYAPLAWSEVAGWADDDQLA